MYVYVHLPDSMLSQQTIFTGFLQSHGGCCGVDVPSKTQVCPGRKHPQPELTRFPQTQEPKCKQDD